MNPSKSRSLAGTAAIVAIGVVALAKLGVVDMRWPWENTNVASIESSVSQPESATIIEIEPIALDCRARIHTVVPIEGRRTHKLIGQTYRTDTVTLNAVGDIDTCVDAADVEVVTRSDGTTRVLVPADAIRFERPRVDAVATLGSVHFDKGMVGKLTDIFPWVSDDSGLSPAAYAYAQTIIGSSECMQRAFATTEAAMRGAYEDALVAQGADPDLLIVDIVGEPDFDAVTTSPDVLDGYDFSVDDEATTCTVSPGAYTPPPDDPSAT